MHGFLHKKERLDASKGGRKTKKNTERFRVVLRTVLRGSAIFAISLIIFFPLLARGASLYFTVPKDIVFVGEDFEVAVMLDTEGEAVNAVSGRITIPEDTFFQRDIRTGDSIIDLWVEPPSADGGKVAFSGIIPGGFQGVREPFAVQAAPGKILTIALRARAPGNAIFTLEDAELFQNDGKGTPIPVKMPRGKVVVEEARPQSQPPAPNSQFQDDTTPPEPFEVTVLRDPALYDNQWTAIFETQDKDSGVGYYEIAEHHGAEPENYVGLKWTRAESPHLLADQERGSHIYVKAVDNSGNIRVARVASTSLFPPSVDKSTLVLTSFGIIITLLLIVFFKRKT